MEFRQPHHVNDDLGVGAVNAQRRVGNFLDKVHEPLHGLMLDLGLYACAHIDVGGASIGLSLGDVLDVLVVMSLNGLEGLRHETVDFLADDNHYANLPFNSLLFISSAMPNQTIALTYKLIVHRHTATASIDEEVLLFL